jgi:hypothetical protein
VKAIADDDNYFHYWPTLSSDLRLLSRKHSRERSWPSFLYITIAAAAVTRSKLFFSPLYGLLLKSWVSLARSHTIAIIITTFIRNCVYPKKNCCCITFSRKKWDNNQRVSAKGEKNCKVIARTIVVSQAWNDDRLKVKVILN